jgi:hypothetical protein
MAQIEFQQKVLKYPTWYDSHLSSLWNSFLEKEGDFLEWFENWMWCTTCLSGYLKNWLDKKSLSFSVYRGLQSFEPHNIWHPQTYFWVHQENLRCTLIEPMPLSTMAPQMSDQFHIGPLTWDNIHPSMLKCNIDSTWFFLHSKASSKSSKVVLLSQAEVGVNLGSNATWGFWGQLQTGGQGEIPFKKPLPQHDNPTKHQKFGEPITFNLSWGSRQECLEVDFGSFSTMSQPTLSFRKSEPST